MVNKTVLITGASSGIGRSSALLFARRGYSLFLVARRQELLEEVAAECRRLGSPRAETSRHDLASPGEGSIIVRRMLEQMGHLDVLVCNAGYGYWGPFSGYPPEAMVRMWQINYQSGYESIFEALPHFRARRGGHIVLVSSIIGKKGMPFSAPYSATKFAQVGLGEALWGELRDEGIGVTVICPGYTSTEFHEVASPPDRTRTRPIQGQRPEVVAKAIVRAVERGRKEVHLTFLGKLLMFINRISETLGSWVIYQTARMDQKNWSKKG